MELQMIVVVWDTDTFSIYKNKKSIVLDLPKLLNPQNIL